MLAVNQQPFIVFTPSTPTLTSTPFDDATAVYPSYADGSQQQSPHRRASIYRSHSVPDPRLSAATTRSPVILHRPSSSFGSRWTFAKARRSILDTCWRTEESGAVASAISNGLDIDEKPMMPSRAMSDGWAASQHASWNEEDDGEFSEPDSTPSTPVFPHRVLASSSTIHGSRAITLISTFVIALAFASLAFTTFFHPTFGDKISKLPETGDVNTPQAEEAWSHRFFHFDGMFGHSDDDGLVGISSSNMAAAGSGDQDRDLRKRTTPSAADYYGAETLS
jgi:hypothetical protein